MSRWPFNAGLPKHLWTEIQADSIPDPVPGCVSDGHRLEIVQRLYEAVALTGQTP